jgi:hypothetical protein
MSIQTRDVRFGFSIGRNGWFRSVFLFPASRRNLLPTVIANHGECVALRVIFALRTGTDIDGPSG